jgi:hypothetical protein
LCFLPARPPPVVVEDSFQPLGDVLPVHSYSEMTPVTVMAMS